MSLSQPQFFHKTMDNKSVIRHADGKTCVFWDVEDYPIPDSIDSASFYLDIQEAFKKQGCDRDVSIHAYVDKCSDELRREYEDAGFHIKFIPLGGKDARIRTMFLDMLLWAFESPKPTNVILLAKNIGDEIGNLLQSLYIRRHGILSSQTQQQWQIPSESHTWFLTSLFDGPDGSSQRLDNKKQKTNAREI